MSRGAHHAPVATPAIDPGGPLVALCQGYRCSALRVLAASEDPVAHLRDAVARTRGAVLVTADCVGACALAAVAAVAHRDGRDGSIGSAVWLTGVQEPERAAALADWVGAGGPGPGTRPDVGVPGDLVDAVAGLGPPPRLLGRRT